MKSADQDAFFMRGSRGGGGGQESGPPPPKKKNHKKYRVSWQYWSGSPENHNATKPAFNVGPSSAHQQNAISMAFRWRVNDSRLIVYSQLKKPTPKLDPFDKTFLILACTVFHSDKNTCLQLEGCRLTG